jgi:hypothetical protein
MVKRGILWNESVNALNHRCGWNLRGIHIRVHSVVDTLFGMKSIKDSIWIPRCDTQ